MLEDTSIDYAKYLKLDLAKELAPAETAIEDMLTRLEEFESMVLMVQQERGNVVGLTGTLSQILDKKDVINTLCSKVDVLESLVINVRQTLDSLEDQIESVEEQTGYIDNSSIKNFFIPKMFKRTVENKPHSSKTPVKSFKTHDYFNYLEEAK